MRLPHGEGFARARLLLAEERAPVRGCRSAVEAQRRGKIADVNRGDIGSGMTDLGNTHAEER